MTNQSYLAGYVQCVYVVALLATGLTMGVVFTGWTELAYMALGAALAGFVAFAWLAFAPGRVYEPDS